MKNLIYLLTLLLFPLTILSQQVTIKGNKFYINESEFYPVCVHYHAEGFKNTPDPQEPTQFELLYSPVHSYNLTNGFECNSYQGCFDQMQTDFNYISSMGFNTVRISIAQQFKPEIGLFMSYIVPGQTEPYQPVIDDFDFKDPNDPALLRLLNFTESILQCANNAQPNPLKIILLVKADITYLEDKEVELRSSFLNKLSYFISQSSSQNALLAYDLFNEPYYHIVENPYDTNKIHRFIEKDKVCNIVTSWYNLIKNNAPNHLITLGSGGDWDIFDWDISLLKLDFISLHYYPYKTSLEDVTLQSTQNLMRIRTLNRLFWLNNNSLRPWIIGETGFTSNETGDTDDNGIFNPIYFYSLSHGFNGTNSDLADYVDFSLNSTCGCGGSGYTWFCYQDVAFDPLGHEYFPGNFFGLIKRFVVPSPIAEKQPAVDFIRYYNPTYNNFCPVDYSPTYDSTKLYYNPNGYSCSSTKQIYGYIKDIYGNPIKDAVIIAHDIKWRLYSTFSDTNGFYRIIPNIDSAHIKIIRAESTAIGAGKIEITNFNGMNGLYNFTLNQVKFDKTLSNIIIYPYSDLLYEAPRFLNLKNVFIVLTAAPVFQATKEIIINYDFFSEIGTNSHFKIQNVFIDCSLINN